MNLSAGYINEISRTSGFDAANLEKVIRLKEVLAEFNQHTFLRGKLVLKGGTAINLFFLGLPRLSVDIDLNYIGQIEREPAQKERLEIEKAAEQVCRGLGYKIQRGKQGYALFALYLGFMNRAGRPDQIQVEINFVMRTCALQPDLRTSTSLGEQQLCRFPVLAIEELVAGKLKAFVERQHPRDVYDLCRFRQTGFNHDPELVRKLAVLFCSTLDRDFRQYGVERYAKLKQSDVERLLYPLLKAEDRPTAEEMMEIVRPILADVLNHEREQSFLRAMAQGRYQPELLFPQSLDILQRVRRHPALLWKAENVAKYLAAKNPSG